MDNLRKTLGCLLLFLFAAVTSTYAQVAKQYSGTVTDADSNEPVIGVNVTLKDAQTGTVTDLPENSRLVLLLGLHYCFLISDT